MPLAHVLCRCGSSGCGGPLCGNSTAINATAYNIECCVGYIQTYGQLCSSNFTAPCVLTKLNVTYTPVYNSTYDAYTYREQKATPAPTTTSTSTYAVSTFSTIFYGLQSQHAPDQQCLCDSS